ncbi:hypothetical protein C8D92_105112 [Tamilnaduibacter salinus]|uniref:DUF503 domain-containing protein n=1 Tax=Tamilnaduibacter salinus TaxID=1484056 RepID=A0A2U1CWJ3_9GAMM|nr:DUF503 domain-containing protein [Tamilnaduibacter salinus]PVY76359.1 hypothetical protein C8D92_105112 [Tamilnaduibacter salinus]
MSDALRRLLDNTPEDPVITPHVGVMTLRFELHGCLDGRDKQRAFAPLKSIWGREPDLAVSETGDQDALDRACWSIAALGPSSQQIRQRLDQIEKAIAERIDAPIVDVQCDVL